MSKSKNARKRTRAKQRRAASSPRGRQKRLQQIFNHLIYCPPSGNWWVSNGSAWTPEFACSKCRLRYRPTADGDEIFVKGSGRFPTDPTVLDLLACGYKP